MNYSADRAITNPSEDLLGRASFASQLGQAICDYKGEDSLVLGLFGKWGTGKTSVINMALQHVEKDAQDTKKKTIILRFAPWNYTDKNNLIRLFFKELQSEIELKGDEELKKKIGNFLKDYADILDVASLIPVYGTGIAAFLKTTAKAGGELLSKSPDLNLTKIKLAQALRDAECRIIVVIDDIDRLTNEQIQDIFQLVKQVGDLPNIIYILIMDRDVVSNALTDIHKYDGNEYLEKIVQIPFEIPELKRSKLHEIFFAKLEQIIRDLSNDIVWNQEYLNRVFSYCIEPYLNTLRDINRVINVFSFKYNILFQETSFEDMIGITTIEVLEPVLYRWIANNKDAVCGGGMHGLLSKQKKPDEYRQYYENEFEQIGLESKKALKCISAMFPVFARDIDMHFYDNCNSSNVRSKMRIADAERFELYFALDLDSIKISRSVINECIYSLNDEDLTKVITEICNQGNFGFFIDEMKAMSAQIPDERIASIATVIIKLADVSNEDSNRGGFLIPVFELAWYLVDDLIKRLKTDKERFELYKMILQNCSNDSLGQFAYRLDKIEHAYGRFANSKNETLDQIISVKQLEELEVLYVKRVKKLFKSKKALEIKNFNIIIYLWKCFDEESANKFINSLLTDDTKKLKLLCLMAGRWTGTKDVGWGYNSEDYSGYFTDEEIKKTIENYDKKKLNKFSDLEQIKIASFILNYEGKRPFVTEDEAKGLIMDWKDSAMT